MVYTCLPLNAPYLHILYQKTNFVEEVVVYMHFRRQNIEDPISETSTNLKDNAGNIPADRNNAKSMSDRRYSRGVGALYVDHAVPHSQAEASLRPEAISPPFPAIFTWALE